MNKEYMKKGFTDAVPIVVGYIPIAITYDLMAKT